MKHNHSMDNNNRFNASLHSVEESDDSEEFILNIAFVYKWVVYTVLGQLLALFGIGTNIINIMCFVKQGFKDPVNISLLGMAISDLLSLITISWSYISMNPAFNAADLSFDPVEVQYLITGIPHMTFATITAWITAIITLERCLCITSPLKIKTIITTRRVTFIIVLVFLFLMLCQTPVYVANRFGIKYFPHRNKTAIGLMHTKNGDRIESWSYLINNFSLPFCAFLTIIICTVTLVIELKIKIKWREKSATSTGADRLSSRNQKVSKMVVMISTLFIFCFIPNCVLFVAMSTIPNFSMIGKYRAYVIMISGVGLFLESVNSSSNIFIYYSMSIKYKTAFQQIFYKNKPYVDLTLI